MYQPHTARLGLTQDVFLESGLCCCNLASDLRIIYMITPPLTKAPTIMEQPEHSATVSPQIMDWLLNGDVSIAWQTHKDLLDIDRPALRARIATEGWGHTLLKAQRPDLHWGEGFYAVKWISTHYTLLDLKHLGLPGDHPAATGSVDMLLDTVKERDGGVNPASSIHKSDVCINGMFLNYACYFGADACKLHSIVDFTLSQQLPDGGFNCRYNRQGARHSSVHSTLSVLEGIESYRKNGYTYRLDDMLKSAQCGTEFLLMHRLYKSDRTGLIISPRFLKFPYPCRWFYDIMRALDHFATSSTPYDPRMRDALEIIISKRNKEGRWKLNAPYSGKVHLTMEEAGKPSRWNTLRVLRILRKYAAEAEV